ncbi:hypothetical protein B2J88_09335 [Rhodococcus sp. SRB_17]|uniref:hypothetical protein n=1 Tax=Rhodococcus sp. OK302 TaxID=1882769 RepID=UPI000B93C4FD|nr:hypothetical protein [Rhodococcus sp. OK302]NMM84563.1 hypothetical protein [Rhodococcus sp. SRB_17]OYD71894.1 hypothetical protein BDB13_5578 [Rhodococcus sp. OK302]
MSAARRNGRDTEKRWSDPEEFRRAAIFTIVVVGTALAVLLLDALAVNRQSGDSESGGGESGMSGIGILAFAPSAVFLIGGLAAFVQTYRVWRRSGTWPIWQGAGWFLMVLMLFSLGLAASDYGGSE